MRYPQLVRDRDCKTAIDVVIYSQNTGEDGEPIILFSKQKMKCNYQGSAKRRYDAEHNIVELNGVALFNGDAFHTITEITSGEVIVFGEKRQIIKGTKERNPDGSVNYTRLELK